MPARVEDRLIVALDVETDKEALSLLRATKKFVDIYKVGPGLVLRYGPDILKKIKKFSCNGVGRLYDKQCPAR